MADFRRPLTSVLVKPSGPDCNFDCKYCFYLERAAQFPAPGPHRMNATILEALVRQTMTAGANTVSFSWQGGEPTLMGVPFFEQAVEWEKHYGRDGQTVGNGLQTNGQLIDDDWCRFLRANHFLVGLSLDGPQAVHDVYRLTAGGRPTWTRVMDAGKRLLDAGVEVNALTVINDRTAEHGREIYEFLRDAGFRHMQFIPCLEHDRMDPARPASFSVRPAQLGRMLCEVFDAWRSDFRAGQPTTFVRWFDAVFATYVDVSPPECTLLAECGNYVVVEHNGDVFSCDFFVEPGWKLGNVCTGDLQELLNSPRQREFGKRKAALSPTCRSCRWLTHCRGGCPKERWGNPADPECSYLCEAYQMFFAHADAGLRTLAAAWRAKQAAGARTHSLVQVGHPRARGRDRNAPCPCGSGAKFKHCCGK